jgi:hypothetical protein
MRDMMRFYAIEYRNDAGDKHGTVIVVSHAENEAVSQDEAIGKATMMLDPDNTGLHVVHCEELPYTTHQSGILYHFRG